MQSLTTILSIGILLFVGMSGIWWIYKTWLHARHKGIMNSEKAVHLLLFTRPYCTICKLKQLPIVTQLQKELGDALSVEEMDPTFQTELAEQYRVLTVPSSLIFDKHGNLQVVNYGFVGADRLRHQLQQAVTA